MTSPSRAAHVIAWILQIALCLMFLMAGGAKLAGAQDMVDMFTAIGVGQWFRYVTGLIEVGSAIMLLVPSLAVVGAALLVCTMIGAIIVHFTVLHAPPTGPIVLLVLAAIVLWIRSARIRAVG